MKKEENKTDNLKLIQEAAEKLLNDLQIKAEVKVSETENVFNVQIETEDAEILIGPNGETLSSFQLILSLIVYKQSFSANKQTGVFLRIIANVGDWREKKEEALKQTAASYAEKVVATGEPLFVPYLSSFERRIIHLALADNLQVETISEGEGRERKLIIKLKK